MDHCNSVLAGTAVYLQNRLQSVLNAAARLIFSLRASKHSRILNTQPHCSGTFACYTYRSESSFGCVLWHITVCMAQHRRILQTACGQHQSLAPVAIFVRHDYAAGAADSSCNWAFTRSDRRTDRSVRPRLRPTVCQTSRTDRLDRLYVNQINVACELVIIPPTLQRDWSSDWPVGPTSRT